LGLELELALSVWRLQRQRYGSLGAGDHSRRNMWNTLGGLISIAVGVALLLFRSWFAQYVLRRQREMWGHQTSAREERAAFIMILVMGVAWIAVGILNLVPS
jgi:hypothetical protein